MLKTLILIGTGGFAGSVLRYLVSWFTQKPDGFPYGTLIANVAGCLIIGVIYGLTLKSKLSQDLSLMLTTGFCGGFTTFSAFSVESLRMFGKGEYLLLTVYIGGSLLLGFLATYAGNKLVG